MVGGTGIGWEIEVQIPAFAGMTGLGAWPPAFAGDSGWGGGPPPSRGIRMGAGVMGGGGGC